jgi:transposase-like protein
MKPSETLKPVLPRFSQISCVPSDEGKEARTWDVDETSVNAKGKCCSLYHTIDRDGNWWTRCEAEKRDMEAAKRFDLR